MGAKNCKKIKFDSEAHAIGYIKTWEQTSENKVSKKRAYFCKDCFSWHMTTVHQGKYNGKTWEQRYEGLKISYNELLQRNEALKKRDNTERLRRQIEYLLKQLTRKNELLMGFQGYMSYDFENNYFWYLE